eukprot:CAMPEP_0194575706 /NCGR_PEP_ID=MMETSP0292-20121207/11091_1 /TAXON_ID=39354 /ORGANISM="Heterosigma akashiwo, Strain CCMP2393" /LENGTH=547 /DNA_ID=CAMNT_0039427563 /DNA_START=86 /DNA_END=1729 /DNA_ORIENTATION=+
MAKSMAYNQAAGLGGMLKSGHQMFSGLDEAVVRNIEAAQKIAEIVKTSMGPNGMKKLIVNHMDKVIVTSDAATLLKEMEIQHPAAKMLELAAEQQTAEFGDGSNFVVSFAGELLKLATDLLRMGLHTSEIVEGYRRAYEHCKEVMPSLKVETVTDVRDEAALVRVLRPVIMTKQQGFEELLAPLVARACLTVMPPAPAAPKLNVDHVRIAKLRGGATSASACLRGMVVLRDSENAVKRVADAKVTVFGCGLEASATEAKGTVLIKTAEELLNYNKGEERAMEDAIRAIAESGCRMVAVGGSVSEMALHFLTKYEVMCVKVPSKWELRRLCAAVNATALVRVGAATPDEMGHCDLVEVREVAGRKILVLEQTAAGDTRLATVVLRAATDSVINDLARAVDDAVNAVKTLCRDGALVAGGGAFEAELAKSVAELGERTAGLDQYAVRKFAEALAVVPRTLAETTGMPGTETMARLTAAHARGEAGAGVDIDDSDVADMPSKGVVDLYACKESAIRLAVDAAVTVLRVDQIIMSKQAGGPKAPPGGGPGM